MNWKFIISWTIKFAICTLVYNLAIWQTGSLWLAFFMALGILILLAIGESYVLDWLEKRKQNNQEL